MPARRVAEALFPDAEIRYVDRFEAMADAFDRLADQRPSTCGAYAARYMLGPVGFAEHGGVDTAREDYLAWLAGTVLEAHELAPAEATRAEARALGLSDDDALQRFGAAFYAWPLRVSGDPAEAGTSPSGVARAISVGSGGALVTLPVAARDAEGRAVLEADQMAGLHRLLVERLEAWRVHVIANYQTDELLDPTAAAYDVVGLRAPDPAAAVPLDMWGVGHFAGIGAFWIAADDRGWVLLLDSYKERGWSGYEPQPVELLRRGLVRSDGREGGLLLVLPRDRLDAARAEVEALGLPIRMWGNGSLEPEGWSWQLGR